MSETTGKPDRTLFVILGVVAALIVVALVVVFTRGAPEPLDASTPEGTVQRYSTAVIDGDLETAAGYLSPQWLDECEDFGNSGNLGDLRITLISSSIHGETARVRVSIAVSYGGGPFGGSDYEFEDAFTLVKDGDGWLIRTAPWDLSVCPTGRATS